MKVVHAKDFVLSRLEHGYYTFSLKEAENAIGTGEKTQKSLNKLTKQGWLFSPSKGFYVIIDAQHTSAQCVASSCRTSRSPTFLKARYRHTRLAAVWTLGRTWDRGVTQVQRGELAELAEPGSSRFRSTRTGVFSLLPDCGILQMVPAGIESVIPPGVSSPGCKARPTKAGFAFS